MVQRIEYGGTVHEFPDDFTQSDISAALQRMPAPPAERGIGDQIVRQLGLTGRAVAEGVMRIPNQIADAGAGAVNLGIRGVNAVSGSNIPLMGRPSEQGQRLIDMATPRPETPTEDIVNRVGGGMVSLATGMGAANAASGLGPGANALAQAITMRPGAQLSSVMGAEAGGGLARQAYPDSPLAEVGGSVAGAAGGLALHGLGRYTLDLARALAEPVTATGNNQIVGRTIRQMAQDPANLERRLQYGVREIVPGSARTTAEVTGDPGLIGLERGVRNMGTQPAGEFALRDAARNQARRENILSMAPRTSQEEAGGVVRTQLGRALERSQRDVNRLYNSVDPAAGSISGPTIWDQVAPTVNRFYARATHGTPEELIPHLTRLRNSPNLSVGDVQTMARELGNMAGQASQRGDNTLASVAGTIRTALQGSIDDAAAAGVEGLTNTESTALRLGAALRRNQGAVYEDGNTAVGRVLDTNQYGRPTMPPERVPSTLMAGPTAARQYEAAIGADPTARRAMQGAFVDRLMEHIRMSTPDAAGNPALSAAKFHDFLQQNIDAARVLFGNEGVANLRTLARDFTSRQMVDTVARAVGSNTVQNLSVANVIGALTRGLIPAETLQNNPLFRPLSWLYRGGEERMRDLLMDAMLNPDTAAALVARATPQNIDRAVSALGRTVLGVRSVEPAVNAGSQRRDTR